MDNEQGGETQKREQKAADFLGSLKAALIDAAELGPGTPITVMDAVGELHEYRLTTDDVDDIVRAEWSSGDYSGIDAVRSRVLALLAECHLDASSDLTILTQMKRAA